MPSSSRSDTPPCPACRGDLDECRQRVRGARRDLQRTQAWLESRALRLDRLIGNLDLYLDWDAVPARRANAQTDLTLAHLSVRPRSDGDFDVCLDHRGPFRFPPMLARLLQLLAEDKGRDMGDGLVGLKSKTHLLTAFSQPPRINDARGRPARTSKLRQAISALRARLGTAVAGGDSLIHTRRNIGFRLAIRRADPP